MRKKRHKPDLEFIAGMIENLARVERGQALYYDQIAGYVQASTHPILGRQYARIAQGHRIKVEILESLREHMRYMR